MNDSYQPSGNRTRAVLDLILKGLNTDDLSSVSEKENISPQDLAALRDIFIEAGSAAVRNSVETAPWLQVNVKFKEQEIPTSQFRNSLLERVQYWKKNGTLKEFCYIHKLPGMRLRFLGEFCTLSPEISSAFQQFVHEGLIERWSCGHYDAEPYQFGGSVGNEIVHRFFSAESLAVLEYQQLQSQNATTIEPAVFSLLLLELLLRAATGDIRERWDVWQRMEITGRTMNLSDEHRSEMIRLSLPARQILSEILSEPFLTIERMTGQEHQIFRNYLTELPLILVDLNHAHEHGKLLWGIREILPFWIIFHWNRMMFDLKEQQRLTFLMTELLSPHNPD